MMKDGTPSRNAKRADAVVGNSPLHEIGRNDISFAERFERLPITVKLYSDCEVQLTVAEYREYLREMGVRLQDRFHFPNVEARDSMRAKIARYFMGNASLK